MPLHNSKRATKATPVQLIAGSKRVYFETNRSGKIIFKFKAHSAGAPDPSRYLLATLSSANLQATESLYGLYSITATQEDAPHETAEWWVIFIKVLAFVPSVTTHDGDVEVRRNDNDQIHEASVECTFRVSTQLMLLARAGEIRASEIHTGYLQNILGEPRIFGWYERMSADGTVSAKGTLEEWRRDLSGNIVDCGEDEWKDVAQVSTLCDETHYPFCQAGSADGRMRTITLSDSPGSAFYLFLNPNRSPRQADRDAYGSYWTLRAIKGGNKFLTAVAARTKDAPFTFVVFYLVEWDFDIDVDFRRNAPGTDFDGRTVHDLLLPGGTGVRGILRETTELPMARDARDAGIEIYGPAAVPEDEEDAGSHEECVWRDGFVG
jgi:hypothetical protein